MAQSLPALPGVDVAVEVVVLDAERLAVAVLAADERVVAERAREALVAVGARDARRTNALTRHRVAQAARAHAF